MAVPYRKYNLSELKPLIGGKKPTINLYPSGSVNSAVIDEEANAIQPDDVMRRPDTEQEALANPHANKSTEPIGKASSGIWDSIKNTVGIGEGSLVDQGINKVSEMVGKIPKPPSMWDRVKGAVGAGKDFLVGQGKQFIDEQTGNESADTSPIARVLRAFLAASAIGAVGGPEASQLATGVIGTAKNLSQQRAISKLATEDRARKQAEEDLQAKKSQMEIDKMQSEANKNNAAAGTEMFSRMGKALGWTPAGKYPTSTTPKIAIPKEEKPIAPMEMKTDKDGNPLLADYEIQKQTLAKKIAGNMRASGTPMPSSYKGFRQMMSNNRDMPELRYVSESDWPSVIDYVQKEFYPNEQTSAEKIAAQEPYRQSQIDSPLKENMKNNAMGYINSGIGMVNKALAPTAYVPTAGNLSDLKLKLADAQSELDAIESGISGKPKNRVIQKIQDIKRQMENAR